MPFSTPEQLLGCAQRELRLRREVYPRLVLRGKMSPDQANREIMMMADIAEIMLERVTTGRLI